MKNKPKQPNGSDKTVVLKLIKTLAKSETLKSVDIVEVSPPHDVAKKTASLLGELVKLFARPKT